MWFQVVEGGAQEADGPVDYSATRLAINGACFDADVPPVSGVAIRMEGLVMTFSRRPGGPCYLMPPRKRNA